MKRLFGLSCLCLLLAAAFSGHALAQTKPQLGDVALLAQLPATRLLADPTRDRLYALIPSTNSVAVIDTTTLTVTATIPIGLNPVDLSISPDGATLYVANGNSSEPGMIGSGSHTVGRLDLATLQTLPALSLSFPAYSLAAGLDGRLYVETLASNGDAIEQVSAASGSVQATLATDVYGPTLGITPDGRTLLLVSADDMGPTTVSTYDVSGATPRALKTATSQGGQLAHLSVSHDGQKFCVPCDDGNVNGHTALFSVADPAANLGLFDPQNFSPLAFSPDDSLLYGASGYSANTLEVTHLSSFQTQTVALPVLGSTDYFGDVLDVQTDRTGSYVFVCTGGPTPDAATSSLVVLATGTGSLTPPALLPQLTVPSGAITAPVGLPFTYQINATHTPATFTATNLPPGFTLDAATGVISGTYTADPRTYLVALTAANAAGSVSASLPITLAANPQSPVITSALQVTAPAGVVLHYALTAANAPDLYEQETALPPGLSFNYGTDTVNGTPTVPGTYPFTVELTNNFGTTTGTITFTITPDPAVAPPVITSALTLAARPDTPFLYPFTATNQPTLYTVTSAADGFHFDPASRQLSGNLSAGVYTFTLTAANTGGSATRTLTVTVAEPAKPVPYFVDTEPTYSSTVGQPLGFTTYATDDPTRYGALGLPPGLTIDPVTGLVAGTPTQVGTFATTLQATNANGTGTFVVTFTITPDLPYVALASPDGDPADATYHVDGVVYLNIAPRPTTDFVVNYTIKGSAINGTDYQLLTGHRKVKAGKKLVRLKVKPLGDLGGAAKKTVKITLLPDPAYFLTGTLDAKVKIYTDPAD